MDLRNDRIVFVTVQFMDQIMIEKRLSAICTRKVHVTSAWSRPVLFCRSRTCADIDECATNNGKGDCEYACVNTDGSFRCSCPAGFSLGGDELTCFDVDECQVENGNCSQKCVNKPGTHECDCFDGYINTGYNGTDVICLDIGKILKTYVQGQTVFTTILFQCCANIKSRFLFVAFPL